MPEESKAAAVRRSAAGKARRDFEACAKRVSKKLGLDYNDVRDAYSSNPRCLTETFRETRELRWIRNMNIAVAVASLLLYDYFWPIAPLAAYFAFGHHRHAAGAEKSLREGVARYRASLAPPIPAPQV